MARLASASGPCFVLLCLLVLAPGSSLAARPVQESHHSLRAQGPVRGEGSVEDEVQLTSLLTQAALLKSADDVTSHSLDLATVSLDSSETSVLPLLLDLLSGVQPEGGHEGPGALAELLTHDSAVPQSLWANMYEMKGDGLEQFDASYDALYGGSNQEIIDYYSDAFETDAEWQQLQQQLQLQHDYDRRAPLTVEEMMQVMVSLRTDLSVLPDAIELLAALDEAYAGGDVDEEHEAEAALLAAANAADGLAEPAVHVQSNDFLSTVVTGAPEGDSSGAAATKEDAAGSLDGMRGGSGGYALVVGTAGVDDNQVDAPYIFATTSAAASSSRDGAHINGGGGGAGMLRAHYPLHDSNVADVGDSGMQTDVVEYQTLEGDVYRVTTQYTTTTSSDAEGFSYTPLKVVILETGLEDLSDIATTSETQPESWLATSEAAAVASTASSAQDDSSLLYVFEASAGPDGSVELVADSGPWGALLTGVTTPSHLSSKHHNTDVGRYSAGSSSGGLWSLSAWLQSLANQGFLCQQQKAAEQSVSLAESPSDEAILLQQLQQGLDGERLLAHDLQQHDGASLLFALPAPFKTVVLDVAAPSTLQSESAPGMLQDVADVELWLQTSPYKKVTDAVQDYETDSVATQFSHSDLFSPSDFSDFDDLPLGDADTDAFSLLCLAALILTFALVVMSRRHDEWRQRALSTASQSLLCNGHLGQQQLDGKGNSGGVRAPLLPLGVHLPLGYRALGWLDCARGGSRMLVVAPQGDAKEGVEYAQSAVGYGQSPVTQPRRASGNGGELAQPLLEPEDVEEAAGVVIAAQYHHNGKL